MDNYKNFLEDLTSSKEEYDLLDNTDHIFILKGKTPDDNNIFEALNIVEHSDWCCKLRGDFNGPFKLANNENNQNYCHGYIFGVTNDNLLNFEKSAMLTTIMTGYYFSKLDLYNTKKEIKDAHFTNLFEEV